MRAITATRFAAPSAREIGRAAALALHDELALSPKPGLVTPLDRGSHADMDAHTFMRSVFALRGYFGRIAALGGAGAPFQVLERCGIEAEARMLAATGGINTHRGAIFMLGLLCAAAGALTDRPVLSDAAHGRCPDARLGARSEAWPDAWPDALRETLRSRWGEALSARSMRPSTLPGGMAARRLGLRSASEEAAQGFPTLFEVAWPALRAARASGLSMRASRLQTLFAVMAELDDSNLAHRGGLEGLRFAQAAARDFLASGGVAAPGGWAKAEAIGREFVRRNLSPGGAADTLAAACWLDRLV